MQHWDAPWLSSLPHGVATPGPPRRESAQAVRHRGESESATLGSDAGGSGVACSPDSTRCYVALSEAGEVVEVDITSAKVMRRFAARKGVDGVAYVPRHP